MVGKPIRKSSYASEAQKELADVRAKIQQLRPTLDKSTYLEGLMELRAPQAGTVKDVATTTEGAVVQPGTVVMTLVPTGEKLYADVYIKNEDIGFVEAGQTKPQQAGAANSTDNPASQIATYKARIELSQQHLNSPKGQVLNVGAGMQIVAEIHQGHRTVLEYLLSPVSKAVQEAGREK